MAKKIKLALTEFFMIITAIVTLIPIVMVVINSFKDKAGAANTSMTFPETWHIVDNYKEVFVKGGMLSGYKNSFIVSFFAVTMIVIIGSMMGYVIQRRNDKFTAAIGSLVLLGMIIPSSIAPTYLVLKAIGLAGTHFGLSLVYLATMLPLATFIYVGAFKSISKTLDDAAAIDGCGPFKTFFYVIFPLIKPATVTVLVISFMTVWNDMMMPLIFLNSPKKYTVVLTTYLFYGARSSDWHLVFANIVLVSLPVIMLYFTLQRYVVAGMTGGAIKE